MILRGLCLDFEAITGPPSGRTRNLDRTRRCHRAAEWSFVFRGDPESCEDRLARLDETEAEGVGAALLALLINRRHCLLEKCPKRESVCWTVAALGTYTVAHRTSDKSSPPADLSVLGFSSPIID
jgi:hypothetical protein